MRRSIVATKKPLILRSEPKARVAKDGLGDRLVRPE
jgi:hypothetical protein